MMTVTFRYYLFVMIHILFILDFYMLTVQAQDIRGFPFFLPVQTIPIRHYPSSYYSKDDPLRFFPTTVGSGSQDSAQTRRKRSDPFSVQSWNGFTNAQDFLPFNASVDSIHLMEVFNELVRVIKKDLLIIKYPTDEIVTRPEGLPSLALLFAQEYRLPISLELGSSSYSRSTYLGDIRITDYYKNQLKYELGNYDYTLFMKELSIACHKYWEEIKHNLVQISNPIKSYYVNMKAVLRSEIVCASTKQRITSEYQSARTGRILFVQFIIDQTTRGTDSYILRQTHIKESPWYGLHLYGTIPFPNIKQYNIMNNPTDDMTQFIFNYWSNQLEKQMKRRSTVYSKEHNKQFITVPSTIKLPDYETQYLKLTCPQLKIFSYSIKENSFSFHHCVMLPVSIHRLFPEEKIAIQCRDLYPEGASVIYIQIVGIPDTREVIKVYKWRYCSNGAWSPPTTITQAEGDKLHHKCINRQHVDDA